MLKQRLITAALLIIFFFFLLFKTTPFQFFIITGLLIPLCGWEWTALMGLNRLMGRFFYLFCLLCFMFLSVYVPIKAILMTAFFFWISAFILVAGYPRLSDTWGKGIFLRGLMGFFVFIPCWRALNVIRDAGQQGILLILFLFVLIAIADSTAYFVGKKWGKTKLAKEVSPGKSIEGVIGGVLGATLFVAIVLYLSHAPFITYMKAFAVTIVTVIFSVLGDLFESMLKRKAGVKDSGTLLPGHGGLLDRFDSLFAAAPIFALGLIFF